VLSFDKLDILVVLLCIIPGSATRRVVGGGLAASLVAGTVKFATMALAVAEL